MKTKLTPELSYIIGLWSKRRTVEGIGIIGYPEAQEVFVKEVLSQNLTPSDKMLTDADKVYFYHSRYRKFFQQVEEDKLERYKYLNEYAASYLAGVFDAVGGITERGVVYLNRFNSIDEVLLLRLGFPVKKSEGKLLIGRPKAFLLFIKNYTKLFTTHPVMETLKKKGRR
ncbi:hypothetical protein KJ780_02990 [Candidatus Micrarchaeota archaeon]|nr:hypothetical protein [Candidatus Micrarchaeota archaeon]MBU1934974.1 hypothetical protein [Patescibacteria group bacterium]